MPDVEITDSSGKKYNLAFDRKPTESDIAEAIEGIEKQVKQPRATTPRMQTPYTGQPNQQRVVPATPRTTGPAKGFPTNSREVGEFGTALVGKPGEAGIIGNVLQVPRMRFYADLERIERGQDPDAWPMRKPLAGSQREARKKVYARYYKESGGDDPLGAFSRSAGESVLPTGIGMMGGSFASELAAAALPGKAGAVAKFLAPFTANIIGTGVAAYGAGKGQDAITRKLAQEIYEDIQRDRVKDNKKYPDAVSLGTVAAGAPFAKTAKGLQLGNRATEVAAGVAGNYLQSLAEGKPMDWRNTAMQVPFDALMPGETGLGELFTGAGRAAAKGLAKRFVKLRTPARVTNYATQDDRTPDSNSKQGIGAFPHSSKPGSMIPGVSVAVKGSTLGRQLRQNGIKPGDTFTVELNNGQQHTFKWDDTVPEHGSGDLDVYNPNGRESTFALNDAQIVSIGKGGATVNPETGGQSVPVPPNFKGSKGQKGGAPLVIGADGTAPPAQQAPALTPEQQAAFMAVGRDQMQQAAAAPVPTPADVTGQNPMQAQVDELLRLAEQPSDVYDNSASGTQSPQATPESSDVSLKIANLKQNYQQWANEANIVARGSSTGRTPNVEGLISFLEQTSGVPYEQGGNIRDSVALHLRTTPGRGSEKLKSFPDAIYDAVDSGRLTKNQAIRLSEAIGFPQSADVVEILRQPSWGKPSTYSGKKIVQLSDGTVSVSVRQPVKGSKQWEVVDAPDITWRVKPTGERFDTLQEAKAAASERFKAVRAQYDADQAELNSPPVAPDTPEPVNENAIPFTGQSEPDNNSPISLQVGTPQPAPSALQAGTTPVVETTEPPTHHSAAQPRNDVGQFAGPPQTAEIPAVLQEGAAGISGTHEKALINSTTAVPAAPSGPKLPAPPAKRNRPASTPKEAAEQHQGIRHEDQEAIAEALGYHLPGKESVSHTEEIARAFALAPEIDPVVRDWPANEPLPSREHRVRAAVLQQEALREVQRLQSENAPQGQIDAHIAEAARYGGMLYASGSEAGRDLALQKILVPNPEDTAAMLGLLQGMTAGKASPAAQREMVRLSEKAKAAQAETAEKLEKKAQTSERRTPMRRKESKPATERTKADFGADNKTFTREKMEAAKKRIALSGARLNASTGIPDPAVFRDMVDIGGYYLEGGLRRFGEWASAMREDVAPNASDETLGKVWNEIAAKNQRFLTPDEAKDAANERLKTLGQKRPSRVQNPLLDIATAEYAKGVRDIKAWASAVETRYGSTLTEDTRQSLYEEAARLYTQENRTARQVKKEMARLLAAEVDKTRPGWQKTWGVIQRVVNLPKALVASMDLSGVGNQAQILALSNPSAMLGKGGKEVGAFKEMLRAAGREEVAQGIQASLLARQSSRYGDPDFYAKAGLDLAELDGAPGDVSREEAFQFDDVQRIPGLGRPIRASDRAYTIVQNVMRANVFDSLYQPGMTLEEAQGLAAYINVASGRGSMGPKTAAALGKVSAFFFSPRFALSRIQYLVGAPIITAPTPRVRKIVAMQYLRYLGTMGLFLGLALASGLAKFTGADDDGAQLEVPTTDGKKLVISTNPGLSQYVTYARRVLQQKKSYGEFSEEADPVRLTERLIRSKLSPAAGVARDWVPNERGERVDYIGRPVTWQSSLKRLILPLSPAQIYEGAVEGGMQKEDAIPLIAAYLLSSFGFNARLDYRGDANKAKAALREAGINAKPASRPRTGKNPPRPPSPNRLPAGPNAADRMKSLEKQLETATGDRRADIQSQIRKTADAILKNPGLYQHIYQRQAAEQQRRAQ